MRIDSSNSYAEPTTERCELVHILRFSCADPCRLPGGLSRPQTPPNASNASLSSRGREYPPVSTMPPGGESFRDIPADVFGQRKRAPWIWTTRTENRHVKPPR